MPTARYYKSLFIPSLEGQYLLWKKEVLEVAKRVDEIVQMGNIIGCNEVMADKRNRGPNNALINYILIWRASYYTWTQLIGPNEIMALNFPDLWTCEATNKLIRDNWFGTFTDAKFQTATVNKKRLVTHGGLTYGEWLSIGKPETAEEAAEELNKKYNGTLYQGECFKLHGRPNYYANPIFADPLREVYGSWITAPDDPPFGQIHTENGLNTIEGRDTLNAPLSLMGYLDDVKYTSFGSVVTIRGKKFTSIAPEIPMDDIIKIMPKNWSIYVEKIPVIDIRDEIFNQPNKNQSIGVKK